MNVPIIENHVGKTEKAKKIYHLLGYHCTISKAKMHLTFFLVGTWGVHPHPTQCLWHLIFGVSIFSPPVMPLYITFWEFIKRLPKLCFTNLAN